MSEKFAQELASVQREAEDQLVALQAAVLTLKHENGQLLDRVQGADAEKDAAVSTHVAYLQEDICALIDERNELQVGGGMFQVCFCCSHLHLRLRMGSH